MDEKCTCDGTVWSPLRAEKGLKPPLLIWASLSLVSLGTAALSLPPSLVVLPSPRGVRLLLVRAVEGRDGASRERRVWS